MVPRKQDRGRIRETWSHIYIQPTRGPDIGAGSLTLTAVDSYLSTGTSGSPAGTRWSARNPTLHSGAFRRLRIPDARHGKHELPNEDCLEPEQSCAQGSNKMNRNAFRPCQKGLLFLRECETKRLTNG